MVGVCTEVLLSSMSCLALCGCSRLGPRHPEYWFFNQRFAVDRYAIKGHNNSLVVWVFLPCTTLPINFDGAVDSVPQLSRFGFAQFQIVFLHIAARFQERSFLP
jgi:hypothetical protein